MNNFRSAITLALMYIMIFIAAVGSTACPQKSAMKKAVDASYRLPATTNDLINKIRDGRNQGVISPETAANLGVALNKIAQAETVYVGLVKSAVAASKKNGGVFDPAKLLEIRNLFDTEIVGPFIGVLETLKFLSGEQARMITVALTAVRLLLNTIGIGIGSTLIERLVSAARPITPDPASPTAAVFNLYQVRFA